MYKFLMLAAGLLLPALQAAGAPQPGVCEGGAIARCSIEYYNDGSRAEFYQNAEGVGRVEWRFTGQDQKLTNIFFYPGKGVTTELELDPVSSVPQASLTYTTGGKLLSWRKFNGATNTWKDVPLANSTHTLERFVDPGRRLLRREDCSRRDIARCTLTRNADGSSTERLFFPNGKLWEENTYKTSNRLDFEFASFDFWGRETMRKIYDRASGNLQTAFWFNEDTNQTTRYIYDLKTGKETSTVIYDASRRVRRWEENGPDGLVSKSVVFAENGFPVSRQHFEFSRLTQAITFYPNAQPKERLTYSPAREIQTRETYDEQGHLVRVECLAGPCKNPGYTVYPVEKSRTVCEAQPTEPQCRPKP